MTKGTPEEMKKKANKLKQSLKRFARQVKRNANSAGQKTKKMVKKGPVYKLVKKLKGGAVSMDFQTPDAQNVSANGAMNQAINKQKLDANNMVNLSKALAGGGSSKTISVPQMTQAGAGGNDLMKSMVELQLQTRAQSEGDAGAMLAKPQGVAGMAGGRKSRKKRRKRRRKTKKKTKRRRRRRKSKRKSRRR
tara:strand:+ start:10001 stop:10576 length:576 start_codon:yes stop_codon:yes gene_type:complete